MLLQIVFHSREQTVSPFRSLQLVVQIFARLVVPMIRVIQRFSGLLPDHFEL